MGILTGIASISIAAFSANLLVTRFVPARTFFPTPLGTRILLSLQVALSLTLLGFIPTLPTGWWMGHRLNQARQTQIPKA